MCESGRERGGVGLDGGERASWNTGIDGGREEEVVGKRVGVVPMFAQDVCGVEHDGASG